MPPLERIRLVQVQLAITKKTSVSASGYELIDVLQVSQFYDITMPIVGPINETTRDQTPLQRDIRGSSPTARI